MANDILAAPRILVALLESDGIIDTRNTDMCGRATAVLAAKVNAKAAAMNFMLRTLSGRGLVELDPHLAQRKATRTEVIKLSPHGERLAKAICAKNLTLDDLTHPEKVAATRQRLKGTAVLARIRQTRSDDAADSSTEAGSHANPTGVTAPPAEESAAVSAADASPIDQSQANPPASVPQSEVLASGEIFTYRHQNDNMVKIVRYLMDQGGYLGLNQGDHLARIANAVGLNKDMVDNLLRNLAREGAIRRQVNRGKTTEVKVIASVTQRPPQSKDPAEVEAAMMPGSEQFKVKSERQIYVAIIEYLHKSGKLEDSTGHEVMTTLCQVASDALSSQVTEGDVWRVLSKADEINAVVVSGRRRWVNTLELGPMFHGRPAAAPPPQGAYPVQAPLPPAPAEVTGTDEPAADTPDDKPEDDQVAESTTSSSDTNEPVTAAEPPIAATADPEPVLELEPEPTPAATVTPIDAGAQAKSSVAQTPPTIELPPRAAEATVSDLNHAAMFELLHQIEANRLLAERNAKLEDELAELRQCLEAAQQQIEELRLSASQLAS